MRTNTVLLGLALLLGVVSGSAVPHLEASNLLALAQAEPHKAFSLWANNYGKDYKTDSKEYSERFSVFQANVKVIHEHQAANPQATFALNEFADLTWPEFSSRLGLKVNDAYLEERAQRARLLAANGWRYGDAAVPEAIDWREKGAVSEVKNQGQCGSCWAFSATGALEGANAIRTGQLVSLSEQQLVDCDKANDTGCNGGLMDYAFAYVSANGGLDTEDDYRYWSGYGIGFWCNKRKEEHRTVVSIDGFEDVPPHESELQKAVAHQPIAVGICAGSSLMFYSGGVLTSCCEGLNHGVLAVGYGTDAASGSKFWVVKNSWGGGWGESGYFRLKMGDGPGKGLCGVASTASYPVKSKPNKPVDEVCDMFGWTMCAPGGSCSCSFSLFGMLCLWHDCCPLSGGVTCPDLQHCCPAGTSCDQRQGVCVSQDGEANVPWTPKVKASVAASKAEQKQRAQEERPLPRARWAVSDVSESVRSYRGGKGKEREGLGRVQMQQE